MRTILENYLRKKLKQNPSGTIFTRFLMRFYDCYYIRKDFKKGLFY